MSDNQTQRELVDFADIAVRVASQFRLLKGGRQLSDEESLFKGLEFVEKAKNGGSFLSRQYAQFNDTLRPLNWATDVYLETLGQKESTTIDYADIVHYLERIGSELSAVIADHDAKVDFDALIIFFEALGESLGMRADQQARRTSIPLGFGHHASV